MAQEGCDFLLPPGPLLPALPIRLTIRQPESSGVSSGPGAPLLPAPFQGTSLPGRASVARREPARVTASACWLAVRFGVRAASACPVGEGGCGPRDPSSLWTRSPGQERLLPLWHAWDLRVALHSPGPTPSHPVPVCRGARLPWSCSWAGRWLGAGFGSDRPRRPRWEDLPLDRGRVLREREEASGTAGAAQRRGKEAGVWDLRNDCVKLRSRHFAMSNYR